MATSSNPGTPSPSATPAIGTLPLTRPKSYAATISPILPLPPSNTTRATQICNQHRMKTVMKIPHSPLHPRPTQKKNWMVSPEPNGKFSQNPEIKLRHYTPRSATILQKLTTNNEIPCLSNNEAYRCHSSPSIHPTTAPKSVSVSLRLRPIGRKLEMGIVPCRFRSPGVRLHDRGSAEWSRRGRDGFGSAREWLAS